MEFLKTSLKTTGSGALPGSWWPKEAAVSGGILKGSAGFPLIESGAEFSPFIARRGTRSYAPVESSSSREEILRFYAYTVYDGVHPVLCSVNFYTSSGSIEVVTGGSVTLSKQRVPHWPNVGEDENEALKATLWQGGAGPPLADDSALYVTWHELVPGRVVLLWGRGYKIYDGELLC